MPLPCVRGNTAGLATFQATADQRFALGEGVFLRTHFPARFWLQHARTAKVWGEDELLRAVLERSPAIRGNRVFVLFGAAGAGKSEVMRWLLLRLTQLDPERSRFTLRIARTDLDPVRIVSRILETFAAPGLGKEMVRQWDVLRRKPVALANQLVWQALDGLYESDEEILPLSYRLRPVVESNLRAGMAALEHPDLAQRPLQLLSREQLEQIIGDTALDLDPVYEHLRARLQDGFEQLALGGIRLVPALREISRTIKDHYGVRPLLLVDDLVQSMNVYASDLLDYLITLEEGEWDVLLGLTPAAFDWDRRGRELLLRIRELDTVDDRVVKLDLSDAAGDVSAFLSEDLVSDYLMPYLDMYKEAAGYVCGSSCPHFAQCTAFQWGSLSDARLSPFNTAFVKRLWRHLPRGKGRARHLLLAARNALDIMAADQPSALTDLTQLLERDVYSDHPNPRMRALLECYHPEDGSSTVLPSALLTAWDLSVETPQEVRVQELRTAVPATASSNAGTIISGEGTDPTRAAVRDWLEGGKPNPELLKPLRAGIARFVRDIVDPALLAGAGYAQPNGVLRWAAVQDGVSLPIPLEGLDTYTGIAFGRHLARAALHLQAYGEAGGASKARLLQELLSTSAVVQLLYQSEDQRRAWQTELHTAIGCSVDVLAFHLYRIALASGADLVSPTTLAGEACPPVPEMPWPSGLARIIRLLWEDCFRLRDHLYDGHRLARYQRRWSQVSDSLAALEAIAPERVPEAYKLCDRPLAEALAAVQVHVRKLRAWLEGEAALWQERRTVLEAASRLLDGRSRAALERRQAALSASAGGLFVTPDLPPPPSPADTVQVAGVVSFVQTEYVSTDVACAYRLSSLWASTRSCRWLATLQQWRDDLCGLYKQASAFLARAGGSAMAEAPPKRIGELLERITTMLADGQKLVQLAEQVGGLRDTFTSPLGREYQTLISLLVHLLPDGFSISTRFAAERDHAQQALGVWTFAALWLSGVHCDDPPPVLSSPSGIELAPLQAAIAEACAWWKAYSQQLRLLHTRGRRPDLDPVVRFLEHAQKLALPSATAVSDWSRFIVYARRRGTRDLPLFSLADDVNLPEEIRKWLCALGRDNRGLSLEDLSPELLAMLQTQVPQWLPTIRFYVVG